MAILCNSGQPDFVRWLMSDGFVRQSKRALTCRLIVFTEVDIGFSATSSRLALIMMLASVKEETMEMIHKVRSTLPWPSMTYLQCNVLRMNWG